MLDTIVGFDKTIDDVNNNINNVFSGNNIIQKIREDIKNGNLVKIKKSDGTYIWKRIRK